MSQAIAVIIEDYDGKILLHLRDEHAPTMQNQWCLVGGRLEKEETWEAAAAREVREETNLKVKKLKFLEQFMRNDKPQLVYIFHAKVDSRKQKLELGEGKELRFFTPEELLKLIESISYSNQYLQSAVKFITSRVR